MWALRAPPEQFLVETRLVGGEKLPRGIPRPAHVVDHLGQGPFPDALDAQDVLNLFVGAGLPDIFRPPHRDPLEGLEFLDLSLVEKLQQFSLLGRRERLGMEDIHLSVLLDRGLPLGR